MSFDLGYWVSFDTAASWGVIHAGPGWGMQATRQAVGQVAGLSSAYSSILECKFGFLVFQASARNAGIRTIALYIAMPERQIEVFPMTLKWQRGCEAVSPPESQPRPPHAHTVVAGRS